MPKPKRGRRLGGDVAHQKNILSNLARALIENEKIQTTQTKAGAMQPVVEKLVTMAKAGDLHSRRKALALIHDRDIVHKLFAEIGPRYADREGGYTRIIKVGPRLGDAAPMAIIEFV